LKVDGGLRRNMSNISVSLEDLLEAGAHFGHQARRWNPKIAPYLYGEKEGIHIFDLIKTKEKLVEALRFLEQKSSQDAVILFVGTKRQAREKIKEVAGRLGMPYVCNRWIGGLFTNFGQIKKSIDKLRVMQKSRSAGEYKNFTKKEQLLIDRRISRMESSLGGISSLETLPDVVLIIDTHTESTAVAEARKMQIPIVGLVDSNADPTLVDYPIPVNDDAVAAINLILDLVAKAIEEGKKSKKAKKGEEKDSG